MTKISYSIHDGSGHWITGDETVFSFDRDESSPFSKGFPEQVSAQDVDVLAAIGNLVNKQKSDIPNDFTIEVWVSQFQYDGEWCDIEVIEDNNRWIVKTDIEKLGKCDASGWKRYDC